MRFSTVIASVAALVAPVLAQSVDHQVMVGMNGLSFTPNQINASVGDTVTFIFYPKNHTVTQSSFATPCEKLAGGVASGFQPVTSGAASVPAMTIPVNVSTPLWFYCGQTAPVSHCGSGMVFAINANANKSFEAFQATANATLTAATTSGSNTTSSSGTTTGSTTGSSASPSASTTGTTTSGAMGLTIRSAPILAAFGIAAGLLL